MERRQRLRQEGGAETRDGIQSKTHRSWPAWLFPLAPVVSAVTLVSSVRRGEKPQLWTLGKEGVGEGLDEG